MKSWIIRVLRGVPALVLLGALFPVAAGAQDLPSYAHHVDTITGTIARIDGAWDMQVHDSKGYMDNVRLHQGTVINPTGIKLEPGFRVTIVGRPAGSAFDANEIDTPYHMVGYAYPYPYYGYPYYWGPAVNVGFGFGWGRWHR